MTPPPTLKQFEGQWRLHRVINDHRAGSTGEFVGIGTFARNDTGLAYVERGTLQFDGQTPLRAEREYHWRSAGAQIHVDFANGRPFHSFDPRAPEATHLCASDRYEVSYDFGNWPVWSTVWNVSGPRKAYRMVTTFEKVRR